jgi:hypothetical protein
VITSLGEWLPSKGVSMCFKMRSNSFILRICAAVFMSLPLVFFFSSRESFSSDLLAMVNSAVSRRLSAVQSCCLSISLVRQRAMTLVSKP